MNFSTTPRTRTNRRRPLFVMICAVGLGLTAGGLSSAAAADQGEQQFAKLYSGDVRRVAATASDSQDDLDLAEKLRAAAQDSQATPALQTALLKHAAILALNAPTGIALAQALAEQLITEQRGTAAATWQAWTDAAAMVLQRRNRGTADPLLEPYLAALKTLALAADAEGDNLTAERTLTRLERAAAAQRLKYRADEAALLRARLRYLAPFKALAQRELGKIKPDGSDPHGTLSALEAALALTGNLADVRDGLNALNDSRWNLVLADGVGSTKPPTLNSRAAMLIDAAEYLTGLAKAKPAASLQGRAFFLAHAAALLTAAQTADATGLTTQQKLDLPARLRAAQEATQQADSDLNRQFDSLAQLPWIPLVGPALDNDWIRVVNPGSQRVATGNELQISRNWGSVLRHRRAHSADFVLEGELQRCDAHSQVLLLLREHNLTACTCLQINESQGFLTATKTEGEDAELAAFDMHLPAKQWATFRVVCDGNHVMVWIDGQLKADVVTDGDQTPGGLCIGAAMGECHFRNLRIREL